ncbi:MAG: hypothetical protein C4547_11825 [Phycisphaerales bacterium]|nr:MAG: hypothetical protein C4547_11825 [Phycisphaerales bacterium]
MRLVYKKFDDGTYKLYETDDDGRNERLIAGDVPLDHRVRRVPVFIEVSCDTDSVDDARTGLDNLRAKLDESKQTPVS